VCVSASSSFSFSSSSKVSRFVITILVRTHTRHHRAVKFHFVSFCLGRPRRSFISDFEGDVDDAYLSVSQPAERIFIVRIAQRQHELSTPTEIPFGTPVGKKKENNKRS
jgi:hypothetical protein